MFLQDRNPRKHRGIICISVATTASAYNEFTGRVICPDVRKSIDVGFTIGKRIGIEMIYKRLPIITTRQNEQFVQTGGRIKVKCQILNSVCPSRDGARSGSGPGNVPLSVVAPEPSV